MSLIIQANFSRPMPFWRAALMTCWILLLITLKSPAQRPGAAPALHWVNVFAGTAPTPKGRFGKFGNGGDVFPGATTPFGMVQFSPDTDTPMPGGYFYPDHRITGFSLDHYSGRGCMYEEDIGFLPVPHGPPFAAFPDRISARFAHRDERANPGFYRVRLRNGLVVRLTAAPRAGVAAFTFPGIRGSILINLGHSARGTQASGLRFISQREIAGWAQTQIGCGKPGYRVYFDAVFNRAPAPFGVWQNGKLQPGGRQAAGPGAGAYLSFPSSGARTTVLMKVGLSYVSLANARLNRRTECPGWDFAALRRRAERRWDRALGRIAVLGGSNRGKRIFYTAFYHTLLEPNLFSDANGQYPGFDGRIHRLPPGHRQYDNISGWDFYRSQAPLLGFFFPAVASDIAQSLVNDAEQDPGGGIPRWEQINHNSNGMVGDGNLPLIANLFAFGGRRFDRPAALQAMLRNALKPATRSDGHPVRPHLKSYLRLGWVPAGRMRTSASATLEYANADFAAAQFSLKLGDRRDAIILLRHSRYWRHLFNPHTRYLQPREADGSWPPEAPASGHGWSEGSSAQYTWMVPYDLPGLIARLGGAKAAARRLDTFFEQLNSGAHSRHYFHGNEPGESSPWIYDFLDRPWETQRLVRRIQTTLWQDSPQGLPGNDDGGAMSSWYVFSALGLYPEIPGVGGFVIGSPMFPKVTLRLAHRRIWTISGTGAGPTAPYVRSLKINGRASASLWLPLSAALKHRRLALRFQLASQPDRAWGAAKADRPPSFFPPFRTGTAASTAPR